MASEVEGNRGEEAERFSAWRGALGEVCRRRKLNLILFSTITSTNGFARRIAKEYLGEDRYPPRSLVTAWEQTGGRGRQGRHWVSPAGEGIYASWLEPFQDQVCRQALPLLTATALAGCLDELLNERCLIRWPNDLLIRGRKIGGILIESLAKADSGGAAVVGFGINYSHADSAVPGRAITSVEAVVPGTVSLARLGGALVDALGRSLDDGDSQPELVARYRASSAHREGERITVRTGEASVQGAFKGFDELGRLRLELPSGEERVFGSGEIET
jgi:BirA family biotin operon repressor/biotin-[acetyl-CoA-carboxylase] ligase